MSNIVRSVSGYNANMFKLTLATLAFFVLATTASATSTLPTSQSSTECMDLYFGVPGLRKRFVYQNNGQEIIPEIQIEDADGYRRQLMILPGGQVLETLGGCSKDGGVFILKDPLGLSYEGMFFPPPPYRVGQKWSYTMRITQPAPGRTSLQCEIKEIGPWVFSERTFDDAITIYCEGKNPPVRGTSTFVPRLGKVSEEVFMNGKLFSSMRTFAILLPRENKKAPTTETKRPSSQQPRPSVTPTPGIRLLPLPEPTKPSDSGRSTNPSANFDLPLPRNAKNIERKQDTIKFELPNGVLAQYVIAAQKPTRFVTQEDIVGIYVQSLDSSFEEKGWTKRYEGDGITLYLGPSNSRRRWLAMYGIPFSLRASSSTGTSGVVVLVLGEKREDVLDTIRGLIREFDTLR